MKWENINLFLRSLTVTSVYGYDETWDKEFSSLLENNSFSDIEDVGHGFYKASLGSTQMWVTPDYEFIKYTYGGRPSKINMLRGKDKLDEDKKYGKNLYGYNPMRYNPMTSINKAGPYYTAAQAQAAITPIINNNGLIGQHVAGTLTLAGQHDDSLVVRHLEAFEKLKTCLTMDTVIKRPSPDYMETIEGWRGWQVCGEELRAVSGGQTWRPKEKQKAVCTNAGRHICPDISCACGYWAFKTKEELMRAVQIYNSMSVIGPIHMWGKVIECENGYRSEFAYPKELWLMEPGLEYLGQIYGVPIRTLESEHWQSNLSLANMTTSGSLWQTQWVKSPSEKP